MLRHAGLVAALTSYCAELERSHGTRLTCSAEGDFASIAPEVALCLYRIAQEALRNVIAHAGASRADVRLLRSGDHAEITIADDGKGFDVARSLERGKGLGLVSIPERVRLAGGTVSFEAEPSKGTRVCARDPANAPVKRTLARRRRPQQRDSQPRPRADAPNHRPPRRRPRDRHRRPLAILEDHDFDVVGAVGDGQR